MRRSRISEAYREQLVANLDKQIALRVRKKRLYNRLFKKSPLFIASWAARGLFVILFLTVACLHTTTFSISKEVIQSSYVSRYKTSGRYGGSRIISTLFFNTNLDNYSANISGISIPICNEGDTVIIEKNIFNKPNFFTEPSWGRKYYLMVNFQSYYIVLYQLS